jgi:hypothetical protein
MRLLAVNQLAAELPPGILSSMLGIRPTTAARWVGLSGGNWTRTRAITHGQPHWRWPSLRQAEFPDLDVGLSRPCDWLAGRHHGLGGIAMDRAEFWALIESTKDEDCEQHAQRLKARLGALPPNQIVDFERLQRQQLAEAYRWELWGAAYLIQGGCSDDGFEFFRGWLIGQGRAVFEAALRDPDSLAEHPQVRPVTAATRWDLLLWCEALLEVAADAYETITGRELTDVYAPDPELRHRLQHGPAGDDWNFDDEGQMRRRYPKLWAKLGLGRDKSP